jgi:hypothetical protein
MHAPPSQTAKPASGQAQGVHEVLPQWVCGVLTCRHAPAQVRYPVAHTEPQTPASQVATVLLPEGQAVQRVPQLAGLESSAQVVPQAWEPAAQVYPHAPASQYAVAFVREGHAVHELPQLVGAVSLAQVVPQT